MAQTNFSDVSDLEVEPDPIEYRTGIEDTITARSPGLTKYVHINLGSGAVPPDADNFLDFFQEQNTPVGQPNSEPLILPPLTFGGAGPPSINIFEESESSATIDSFFDIWFDIEIPTVDCLPCDAIKAELEAQQKETLALQNELETASRDWQENAADLAQARDALADAQQALDQLENPKSWAQSGDIYRDSADLRVQEAHSAELWNQYQSGALTAQEYEAALQRGLTDQEREARKTQMINDLKAKVKQLEQDVADAEQKDADLVQIINEIAALVEAGLQKMAELQAKLEACLLQCQVRPVNLVSDFGFGQVPEKGFFERLWDWITGVEDEEPDDTKAAELGLSVDGFGIPPELIGLPPGIVRLIQDIEKQAAQLDPPTVGEGIPPPTLTLEWCAKCDPIFQQIKAKEAELTDLGKQLDQILFDINAMLIDIAAAQAELQKAQAALDRFRNPSSWAESEGRRLDSSDLEVMRDYNRGLWGEYRNGNLTAQELEQKWNEGLSDDERAKRKQQKEADLAQQVAKAQEALDALEQQKQALEQQANELHNQINTGLAELQRLQQEYDACLKTCFEELDVIEYTLGGVDLKPPRDTDAGPITITFRDGLVVRGGESITIDITQSDQYDPTTGRVNIGDRSYPVVNGGIGIDTTDSEIVLDPPKEIGTGRSGGLFCDWFGWFCDDETDETEDEIITGGSVSSIASAAAAPCTSDPNEVGTQDDSGWLGVHTRADCTASCPGVCRFEYNENDVACYSCWETDDEDRTDPDEDETIIGVPGNTSSLRSSASSSSQTSSSRSSSSSSRPPETACPAGTDFEGSRAACQESCEGLCNVLDNAGRCWECVTEYGRQPPEETCDAPYQESAACSAQCDGQCEQAYVRGDDVGCYRCEEEVEEKSCEDVCSENGFDRVGTNWTDYVGTYLNEFVCVSGASASLSTATIGNCVCSKTPSINVNQTPPVCAGTACGDVACGQSATCQQGDTQYTVNCNWGGWQNVGENQFQPKIGQ